MRQSSRRHHQEQQYRHTDYNITFDYNKNNEDEQHIHDKIIKGLDISHDALQSLLNSRFKLIDLVDLLKKTYPKLLRNDQRKELQLIQQLAQTNTGINQIYFN
jgi:7-cyano-7-deazaguanine synthase in queuosine biosynthesis